MRFYAGLLIAALSCAALVAQDGRLSPRFRTVFILEMANGLDQHLASRLTSTRALWVVLDPGSADAVLTQSLDEPFWSWLMKTYPPAAGAPAAANNVRVPAYARDTQGRDTQGNDKHAGTVFLVDPRTRVVLWSGWEVPRKSTPDELDRTAGRFAVQIKAAFQKK